MGDTLIHLPDLQSVDDLIPHCFAELEPGGKLVLSLRDYAKNRQERKTVYRSAVTRTGFLSVRRSTMKIP